MSTARSPSRCCSRARIASDHGSAPQMAYSGGDAAGSSPDVSIASAIVSAYDGVAASPRGRRSAMSCAWRAVTPPDAGTIAQVRLDREGKAAERLEGVDVRRTCSRCREGVAIEGDPLAHPADDVAQP